MTVADISVVLHCIDLCTFRWFDGGGDVAAGSISYSSHRLAASRLVVVSLLVLFAWQYLVVFVDGVG